MKHKLSNMMTFANKKKLFLEGLRIEKIPLKPKQRSSTLQTMTAYLTELL